MEVTPQNEFYQNYYRDFLGKSRYDLSHSLDTSARIGEVFPVLLEEMIPGDHIHCRLSQITNFLPLINPVQGIMQVRFETFFAPAQLLMKREEWEKFISDPLNMSNGHTVDKLKINALFFNDMPFEGFDIINRIAPCFPSYYTEVLTHQSNGFLLPSNNFITENCYSWHDLYDKCMEEVDTIDGIAKKGNFTPFNVFEDGNMPLFGLGSMGVINNNISVFNSEAITNLNVRQRFTRSDISNFSLFDYLGVNHDSLRMRSIRENIENFVNDLKKEGHNQVPTVLVKALYDDTEHDFSDNDLVPLTSIYSVLDSTDNLYDYLECIGIRGYKSENRKHVDFTNLLVLLGRIYTLMAYRGSQDADFNFYRLLYANNYQYMTAQDYVTMWLAISPYNNLYAHYHSELIGNFTYIPTISTVFDLNPSDSDLWHGCSDPFNPDWQIDNTCRLNMKRTMERLFLLAVALRGFTGVYMPLWLACGSWVNKFDDADMRSVGSYHNEDGHMVYYYSDSQWKFEQAGFYYTWTNSIANVNYLLCQNIGKFDILSLPLRMYPRVFNDWYRIPDIDQERDIVEGDEHDYDVSDYSIFSRAYSRDKFVTAFTNPTAKIIRVGSVDVSEILDNIRVDNDGVLHVKTVADGVHPLIRSNIQGQGYANLGLRGNTFDPSASADDRSVRYDAGLKLVSTEIGTQIGGFSIEELRVAVRLQNMADYLNKFSGDYVDYMRSVFTTIPSDASLRRSTIVHSYSDFVAVGDIVTQTNAEDNQTPGERFGIAKSFGKSPDFDYSTKEHGYLITLCSVEPFVGYNQGLSPLWKRFDALDFYTPNMCTPQLIPIRRQELYNECFFDNRGNVNDDVFGYNEKDLDYKVHFNRSTGAVRNSLRTYSLTRDLNASLDHIGSSFQRIDSRDYDYLFNMINKNYNSQFVMNIHFELHKDSVVDENVDPVQGTGLL